MAPYAADTPPEYTDDDRPPLSTVPLSVQGPIALCFLAVLVLVVLLGCSLTRPSAPLHASLVDLLGESRRWCECCVRAPRKLVALEDAKSPLLRGWLATVVCAPRWLLRSSMVVPQQTYLLVWKLLAEKSRESAGLVCYFGLPTIVSILSWLLYAIFNSKKSSGQIEQYLTLLGLVFSLQSVASNLCAEKAAKLRVSLRQMGCLQSTYVLSTYLVEALLMSGLLATVLATLCSLTRLYRNAGLGFDAGVDFGFVWPRLFGLFWAYGLASTSMALFLSTFLSSAPTASMASFALTIVSLVVFIVLKQTRPGSLEDNQLWLIWPPIALELAVTSWSSTLARYPLRLRLDYSKAIQWLVLDAFIYALFALYCERALPTEFGTREPWYFPARDALQLLAKKQEPVEDPDLLTPLVVETDEKPTVEIRSLRKVFGKKHVALDSVSMDLYEGEILCLLGHNGAGKTTMLNILTGLLADDKEHEEEDVESSLLPGGKTTIYGRELGDNKKSVLGVCPQHDVLWPKLTVREHTALCGALKSGCVEEQNADGDALLRTFNLQDRHAHLGHELSGGMRRKLSTACALVGGSKFVILDEPTTGLDPLARRELWDLLATLKPGRTMLLTTHYMDEAEALGDRVAILAKGTVVCEGSPHDLKRELGAGYKLTCELRIMSSKPRSPSLADDEGFMFEEAPPASGKAELEALIRSSIAGAEPWRSSEQHGSRLEFSLPAARAADFPALLSLLEEDVRSGGALGLEAIGISQCDLEDVFERVNKEAETKPEEEEDAAADIEEEESVVKKEGCMSASYYALVERAGGSKAVLLCAQIWALTRKRLVVARRDARATLALVVFPVGFIIAAFSLNAKDDFGPRGHFAANFSTGLIIMLAFVPVAGFLAMELAAERASKLRDVLTVAGCSSEAYLLGQFFGDLVLLALCLLAIAIVSTVTGLVAEGFTEVINFRFPRDVVDVPNSVIRRGVVGYVNLHRNDSAYQIPEDDDWIPHKWHPWIDQVTDDYVRQVEEAFNATDDEWRASHYHESDDSLGLWSRNWTVLWFYPWLFGAQLLAFSYAASFASAGPRQAVVLVPMLVLALLFAPATLLSLVNLTFGDQGGLGLFTISKDAFTGVLLWGAVLCSPHGALLMAMAHASTDIERFASGFPPYSATCLIALIETVLYALATWYVDRRPSALTLTRVDYDSTAHQDGDVALESEAARLAYRQTDYAALHLHGLRKVYRSNGKKPVVAVHCLDLRVESNEIFGLLGANGAGKTTAISMVMRSTYPSAGDARVRGHSVLNDFQNATRHLGVVTQSDTLYDRLTATEHCALFAALRGVKEAETTIEKSLVAMDLDSGVVSTKLASQLSGGQKRKLCTALALIGGPGVVLLDEPSAGLDPVSRRRLWNVLKRTMRQRSVVLTSHSMEESEALCSRVGVMVNGHLRALGTPQKLKAKFGAEYKLKVHCLNSELLEERLHAFGESLRATSTKMTLKRDLVECEMALRVDTVKICEVFASLEKQKEHLGIDSYSLTQPTLEEVFINVVSSVRTAVDEAADDEEDAASAVEQARCCGLDRASHRFLALASGVLAFIIFLTLTGLLGAPPSYDDDSRAYDDDERNWGCHRQKNRGPPCSTSAITLDGIPMLVALVLSIMGCCGCCCCIARLPEKTEE